MALTDYLKKAAPTDTDIMAEMEHRQINNNVIDDSASEVPKQESPMVSPSAQVNVSHRPEWMSDNDWKEATQYYSPERISQLYKGFDPKSADPFYSTLYKSTIKGPEVPDEKRIKASNTIAGITDALSLITQGITGVAGGYIPEQKVSAIKQNADYVQRLRDIYKAERDRYNAGLYQSTIRDIESAKLGYDRDKSGLLDIIRNSRRLKNEKDIAADRWKYQAEKDRMSREMKEKEMKTDAEYKKEKLNIERQNAAANVIRANKTGTGSSSRSLKNGDLEFFDANTASTYTVNEKKFKANAPQMFKMLKDEIFADDENLKKRYNSRKGKLSLQEQEDAVKKYMYDNPEAMKFLGKISKDVDQDKSLIEKKEDVNASPFGLNPDQLGTIENFIGRSEGDDESAIRDITGYLKSEGFDRDNIISIIRKLQE